MTAAYVSRYTRGMICHACGRKGKCWYHRITFVKRDGLYYCDNLRGCLNRMLERAAP